MNRQERTNLPPTELRRRTHRRLTRLAFLLGVCAAPPHAEAQLDEGMVDCEVYRAATDTLSAPAMGGLDTTPSGLTSAPLPEECVHIGFLRDTALVSNEGHPGTIADHDSRSSARPHRALAAPNRLSISLSTRRHLRGRGVRSSALLTEHELVEHDWFIYVNAGWWFSPAAAARGSENQ